MAEIQRIARPQRRIPQPGELDSISRAGQAAGNVRMNPDGITVRAPGIDARGFIDEARGTAMVGAGVADVGGAMRRLGEEQARAVADRQARDAQGMLGQVETALATAIASEPDELKWGDILETHLQQGRKAIESQKMMSVAKTAALDGLTRWEAQQRHQVTIRQAQQSFANAGRAIKADVIRRQDANNFGGAREVLESEQARLYLGEDVVASQIGQLGRAEKSAASRIQREAVEADAAAVPEMWLERNPEPGDMDPDDWSAGQSMARRVISTRVQDASAELGDAMARGDVKSSDDIKQVADGRLGDAAIADAEKHLRNMQSDAWRAENLGEKGVTKNFGALLADADNYQKEADPTGSEYAKLVLNIKTLLPEELRGEITGPLSRKWNPSTTPDAPEPLRAMVRETLGNWYDEGKFGKTKRRVPLTPEDRGWYVGTPEQKWEVDPIARDAAVEKRGAAAMKIQQWLKAHPDADASETKKAILSASNAALLPNDVSTLLRRPPPAVAPALFDDRFQGVEERWSQPNLPTGDGEINPTLLPPFSE